MSFTIDLSSRCRLGDTFRPFSGRESKERANYKLKVNFRLKLIKIIVIGEKWESLNSLTW